MLVNGDDTIAALATPGGRSAAAVIRVSGPRATEIASRITREPLPPPRTAALRTLFRDDAHQEPIDRGLVTVFPGPRSYTGEDVVELSVHGGHLVPALIIERLILAGARQALPGEFTRRAMLNGKLDLLQAEAVADLIDSNSRGAVTAALRQLDGGLTRRVLELRHSILEVEALVAYDIDFPDEDDGPIDPGRVLEACRDLIDQLASLLATATIGETLREGAMVVIAGAPNTGKSSLFNALVGSRRALVTDIPGTTRDAIEAVIDADAWTLRLVDTAGLRETAEVVERLGIEVAENYLAVAQVVLVCGDAVEPLEGGISRTQSLTAAPIIAVMTKSDLDGRNASHIAEELSGLSERHAAVASTCAVSSVSGAGLSELVRQIGDVLAHTHAAHEDGGPMLLRARHQRAVAEARVEMQLFVDAFTTRALPMTVAGTHLRTAAAALESLIGVVGVEDVLDRVFSSFCVGK
jgi:tRNA modification GTPase